VRRKKKSLRGQLRVRYRRVGCTGVIREGPNLRAATTNEASRGALRGLGALRQARAGIPTLRDAQDGLVLTAEVVLQR
jgi:hypothetical protein